MGRHSIFPMGPHATEFVCRSTTRTGTPTSVIPFAGFRANMAAAGESGTEIDRRAPSSPAHPMTGVGRSARWTRAAEYACPARLAARRAAKTRLGVATVVGFGWTADAVLNLRSAGGSPDIIIARTGPPPGRQRYS